MPFDSKNFSAARTRTNLETSSVDLELHLHHEWRDRMLKSAAFRVDASIQIGRGHVSRCLNLAHAMNEMGWKIVFITREIPGDLVDQIKKSGPYTVISEDRLDHAEPGPEGRPNESTDPAGSAANWRGDAAWTTECLTDLPTRPNWLIVDHYRLDHRWENALRPVVEKIMVIDDLANRVHDCDLILDQAYGEDGARYQSLVPDETPGLFGSAFCLLSTGFAKHRQSLDKRFGDDEPLIVHVYFGGADCGRRPLEIVNGLLSRYPDFEIHAIFPDTGADCSLPGPIDAGIERLKCFRLVDDMPAHMAACDVAIGAPGMATWERACIGLPSLYVSTDVTQHEILQRLDSENFCRYAGPLDEVDTDVLLDQFDEFVTNRSALSTIRQTALSGVDGLGTRRVVDRMQALS